MKKAISIIVTVITIFIWFSCIKVNGQKNNNNNSYDIYIQQLKGNVKYCKKAVYSTVEKNGEIQKVKFSSKHIFHFNEIGNGIPKYITERDITYY